MTRTHRTIGDGDGLAALSESDTQVLDAVEERALLRDLAGCRAKLEEAMRKLPGTVESSGSPAEAAEALAHYVARLREGDGPAEARLGAVARRYAELRSRLALANVRLVAHVAKRFRDRGIAYSDLLQEGFCGLLEAIDRFDLSRETKLATYATWWIRQAMQKAVASGAYPVRLTPRHLRQLAQNQGALGGPDGSPEMLQKIHAATRPAVSLDAALDSETNFSLLHVMSDNDAAPSDDAERGEAVGRLLGSLRPREQQVLELRYGLGGRTRLSLSQVGRVMAVSKERVRQIQDRALQKLRGSVEGAGLAEIAFGE